MSKVIIGIATIKERREALIKDVLPSLIDQADEIHVFCTDYEADYLLDALNTIVPNLVVRDTAYRDGLGDRAKFLPFLGKNANKGESVYCFTCDDDLIYPPTYTKNLCRWIDQFDKKAALSHHGRYYTGPVQSFYKDLGNKLRTGDAFNYRCLDEVAPRSKGEDSTWPVTILGTGCLAWHNDLFKDDPLTLRDFPRANMADIWFSEKCNGLDVPRRVVPHVKGYIKHSEKVDLTKTIAATYRHDDEVETAVFNRTEWVVL